LPGTEPVTGSSGSERVTGSPPGEPRSVRAIDLFDLRGRKAIVTGASRGLGLQIATALGEQGAEILITARRESELAQAVEQLRAAGVRAQSLVCDRGDVQAVQSFAAQALNALGHCDILVNNAGTSWAAPAEDHPIEAWQKLVNLNLTGVFVLSQAIGRDSMIPRRHGRILNIASISGLRGNPLNTNEMIAYNTTKGGLVNFTRTLAGEWGEFGITVNALAPGFFPSRLTRGALESFGDSIRAMTPLKRIGGDDDLKGAALLFCSEAGRHITGQILAVDGGMSVV
jgi:NAD(P)-dependent dehydrogenase (short-subunit alcohol dehydrogenase family)